MTAVPDSKPTADTTPPPADANTVPASANGVLTVDLDALVSTIERELIQRSLERTGGNKGQAAKLLNLKRTTLVEKLKRL